MDKELLFKPRLPEGDVEVPGVGTVRVRGLSRFEVMSCQSAKGAALERRMLSIALVDPVLTEAEVGRWMGAAAAGELQPVLLRVQELSGLADDADKEAYKSFRDDAGPGVRVLPGAETRDDGSPDARGDAQ